MTKNIYRSGLFALAFWVLVLPLLHGQAANTSQELVFSGLRSVAQHGQINGVHTDAAGNLYLLLDQGDGVRLLKTDNSANRILAQALLGAAGDAGVALALDPAGNVYVTGTTNSASLMGTAGAAIPNRTDNSTNSFVARFDGNLNCLFVTFTGGSRIAATAVSATADAVFVTGITYAANLPVTGNGIQQAPAYESTQSGFVERFSSDGSTLEYATYLTGAAGSTSPTAIAADATDDVYIAGETTAPGFPTVAALVPAMIGDPSGFLTRLTPAGDGIVWSTFVPGAGLSSIALDSTGQVLLVSGAVSLGQFPVDTVTVPLVPTTYQVLLRIPVAGNAVLSSTLLAPGTQSYVAAAASGGAWVDGNLTAPLLPLKALLEIGNGFAVHVPAGAAIDQTARFGGVPNTNPSYAGLPAPLTSVAVDPSGEPLIAGAVQPTSSSAELSTETYDLPLLNAPTTAFPSSTSDAELTAATCSGSLCAGSAAYLSKLNPNLSGEALAFSPDDLPFVVLRNLGSGEADGLHLSASGSTLATNCPSTLNAGGECGILLSGGVAGILTATDSNGVSQTISFPAYSAPPGTIAFYPRELDFGIRSSGSGTATATITVTNLGTASQTFASILDTTATPKQGASPYGEAGSDCTLAGSTTMKVLAPGGICHITIGFTPSPSAASDGFQTADWLVGGKDVLLTGYSQAASLSVSASEIDFGTQYTNGFRLPRYLYLSNPSNEVIAHAPLALPAGSPFTLMDACPTMLAAGSVCRVRIDYQGAGSTSVDSVTLSLDEGLSVLITGRTLPPQPVTGQTANPNLSLSPGEIFFASAVPVTAVSATSETVTVTNAGSSPFPLSLALSGDFTDTTSCAATLAGGQSCDVEVTFAPSGPGTRQGLLAVTAGAGTSPAYVPLSGMASAILPANNGTIDLGSVALGQPVTSFLLVPQPISPLTVTATGPFSVVLAPDAGFGPGNPPATSYAAQANGGCSKCYLGIRFLPTATGVQTGTLTITSAANGSPYVLQLMGTGLPLSGLLLTPATENFPSLPVNSVSAPQLFTLTNLSASGAAVMVSNPVISGDFAIVDAATGGTACGGALAYTASCFVSVAFAPSATETRTGTLSLSGGGLTAAASLSGSGTTDPGIAINPLTVTFANVPGTTATTQSISVTNTGSSAVQVGKPSVHAAQFMASSNCTTLAAGASCSITVTYTPAAAAASDTLTIPVTNTLGTPVTTNYPVALNGTYTSTSAGLELLPGEAEYGPSATGQETPPRQFTITNLTGKSLTVDVAIPQEFVLTSAPCSGLAPGASCSFSVAFLPLTNGDISGTLYAQATPSDGSAPLTSLAYVEGYGSGGGALTITGGLIVNGVYSFGQVTSGQSATQVFTLANNNGPGSSPITVRRVTSAPPFLSTTNCGMALAVGQSCTVTVTYTPSTQATGGTVSPAASADAGSLVIESDAASGPQTINLTGQGAAVGVSSPGNTPPLATFTLSQGALSFAQTTVGDVSAAQTVTLTNTGTATIQVGAVFATPDFAIQNGCGTVTAGASCAIVVSAAPQTPGTKIATLEIQSNAAMSLGFVSLLATASPSPLTLAPGALNFGPVQVGQSSTIAVQVTNTSASPVEFGSVSASGDYTAGGSCPAAGGSLGANSSCTLQVTFRPTASGTRTGTLSLATTASLNPLTVTLTGIGTQSALTILPSSEAFGSIVVGVSANLSLTLTNAGSAPVANLALNATGDYFVSIPCPQTLAAGASCTAQLTFTPSALGTRPGTLTVTSSDPSSPELVPLTGAGIQGGGFTLTANGSSAATASVTSGQPATYQLNITPIAGFSGAVALTCTPINAPEYASCSLLPASIMLAGAPQNSLATINTITSIAANARTEPALANRLRGAFLSLMLPALWTVWRGRKQLRKRRMLLLAMVFCACAFFTAGCGGGGDPFVRYAAPGTYEYQVTASSTSGTAITQSVVLNLTVTQR